MLLLASSASAAGHEPEWVEFPALKDFEGKPVTLSAWLYRPDGPGPFPALVLLHGCSGQYDRQGHLTPSYRHWAELLSGDGYIALLVDSFNPRGYFSICAMVRRTILERRERVDDAYAALGWLARRPDVRPDRIGLLGWSHGGSGTLRSLAPYGPSNSRFRAAVAFYPGCKALSEATAPYRPYGPLLVLIGEADDWTPSDYCVALTKIATGRGAAMEIVTYPGAHHGFDRLDSRVRYLPNVRNLNKPGGCCGATVGEHPQAREDAIRRTLAFFALHLKN
jgi:dienelactone hydrolase